MENSYEDKHKRKQKLFAYLRHSQEICKDDLDSYCEEYEPYYQYDNWIQEMHTQEELHRAAVYDVFGYTKGDEYIKHNPIALTGRYGDLVNRELAIKEWYEDHGLDSTMYENLEDRETYIWWYEKNEKGNKDFLLNEQEKRTTIMKELIMINKRKQELEDQLKPWLLENK